MKKIIKRTLLISGSVILLTIILLLVAASIFFYKKSVVKGMFEKYLSKRTGIPFTIDKIDYELFPLKFEASGVKAALKIAETEVEFSLKRIEAKGKLQRIWKKQKPLMDSVEIEGAQACLLISVSGEKIDIQKILLNLSRSADYVSHINLRNAYLQVSFSSQKIDFRNLNLSLLSGQKKGEFTYSFNCEKVSSTIDPQSLSLDTSFTSSGAFTLEGSPSIEGLFSLQPLRTTFREKEMNLENVDFMFKGEYLADSQTIQFSQFELKVPPLMSLSGPFKLVLEKGTSFLFQPKLEVNNLAAAIDPFRSYLPPSLMDLEIEGRSTFRGKVLSSFVPQSGRVTSLEGKLDLESASLAYENPLLSIKTRTQGTWQIKGSLPNLNVSGTLRATGGLSSNIFSCRNFSLNIPMKMKIKESSLRFSPFQANIGTLTLKTEETKLALQNSSLKADAEIDLKKRTTQIASFDFTVPSLFSLSGEAKADLSPKGSKWILLKSEGLALQSLVRILPEDFSKRLASWEVQGVMGFVLEANSKPHVSGENWILSAKGNLNGLSFHEPNFILAGESLSPQFTCKARLDSGLNKIMIHLDLALDQGESLWKEHYINWSKIPLNLKTQGDLALGSQEFTNFITELSLSSLGCFTAKGNLSLKNSPLLEALITVSELDLQSFFSFLPQSSGLSPLSIALSGHMGSQIQVKKGKDQLKFKGQIQIEEASLLHKDLNLAIKGVEASIPIYYQSWIEPLQVEEGSEKNGFLKIQEIDVFGSSTGPLTFNLWSEKNKLFIQAFSLDVLGSTANFGESILHLGPDKSSLKGLFSLRLEKADLSLIPLPSARSRLKGSGRVDFPAIEVTSERLATQGEIELSLFDGLINLNRIHIENPFSRLRTISCEADFSRLSLEKVTDILPFGRVTGIVSGEIKDFRLAFGQPESFILRLESEIKKGIPQRFSLKAANDIAVLSSGDQTPIGAGKGWMRFISAFRYKKIGIFCSLKNDVFTLRGTIKEKGVEYLVKGDRLFGINVVNVTPQNRIRFKDMLSRLKRIGRSDKSL